MLVLIYQTTRWHIPQGCNTNECPYINSFHLQGLLPKRNFYIIDFTDSSEMHEQRFRVPFSKAPRPVLRPIHHPSQWAAWALLCSQAGGVYKMTIHLHLVMRLKMHWAANELTNMLSWHDVYLTFKQWALVWNNGLALKVFSKEGEFKL